MSIDPNERADTPYWAIKLHTMSQTELARMFRFAPIGHIVFQSEPLTLLFNRFFKGMTPQLSNKIGWGNLQ